MGRDRDELPGGVFNNREIVEIVAARNGTDHERLVAELGELRPKSILAGERLAHHAARTVFSLAPSAWLASLASRACAARAIHSVSSTAATAATAAHR